MRNFMYYFADYLTKFILMLFGRLRVHQKENLPQSERYVIACIHTGWVDILLLGHSLLPLKIHYMAKIELFQKQPIKWLMEKLNAFPVNRDNPGPSAIKIPRKLIKEGKIVGIFPSGTRTSEDVPLKRGAVTIANYAKAPIIPAAYEGPNNFKDLFRRVKPRIIFGDPITMPEGMSRREALEVMSEQLDKAMRDLQHQLKNED